MIRRVYVTGSKSSIASQTRIEHLDVYIGVLVPRAPGPPEPPASRPLGRAALRLAEHGIGVVFGEHVHEGQITGWVADTRDTWAHVSDVPMVAAYDRFPSRIYPHRYEAMVRALGRVPLANPPALMRLCQDKLATQAFAIDLGIPMPEVEVEPHGFDRALARWGAAYAKPRYGTAGRGVVRVVASEPMPEPVESATAQADGPLFLQRAIPPWPPWRGVCVRVTMQRDIDGSFCSCPPVARFSDTDWVVNAARGSRIELARDFLPEPVTERIASICERVCLGLSAHPHGDFMAEVGIDLVIDERAQPWLLELNSRPLGRLAALAARDPERFLAQHIEACMRPLRFLAAKAGAQVS